MSAVLHYECRTCEGSGRIPRGCFGSYRDPAATYDMPGLERCDDCGGSGVQPEREEPCE